MASETSAVGKYYRQLVILSMIFCLHRSVCGEKVECTPGASLPHSGDCTKYYICDEDNDKILFECPADLLYDPKTTKCELAEVATCFEPGEEQEEDVSSEDADQEDGEEGTEERSTEREGELDHKEFYLVEDDSEESSKDEKSKSDESSEDGFLYTFFSGPPNKEQDKSETKEYEEEDETIEHLELTKTDENDQAVETKTDKTNLIFSFADRDDVVPIKKRDLKKVEVKNEEPQIVKETQNIKTNTGKTEEKVTQEKPSKSNESVSTLDESSSKYILKQSNGTNFLYLGSSLELVANWTEQSSGNWTDLKIFWKHPTNEDFRGTVSFYYPETSPSDETEIKSLLINILSIGDKAEDMNGEASDDGDTLNANNTDVPKGTGINKSETKYHPVETKLSIS